MKHRHAIPLSFVVIAGVAMAQTPPPPPDADAPPPVTEQAAVSISGQVKQYLLAPRGEVNGVLLADGTQVVVPPHLSDSLIGAVQPGDTIQIQGRRENANRIVAQQITNSAKGTSVVDQGPSGPKGKRPRPTAPDETGAVTLSAQGSISALLNGPRGELNGAVLDDGSVIRFAPRAGLYYANQLQIGKQISVSGFGVENRYGRVIEAQELRAN